MSKRKQKNDEKLLKLALTTAILSLIEKLLEVLIKFMSMLEGD